MMIVSPPDSDALIDLILARAANHMTLLAGILASTEAALSGHLKGALACDVTAFKDVQNLDYLHQSMTDTATLLGALGDGCRTQSALVEKLKLETTRSLVCGVPFPKKIDDSGAIDIF